MNKREAHIAFAKIHALCVGAQMHLDNARAWSGEDKARAINEAQDMIDRVKEISKQQIDKQK